MKLACFSKEVLSVISSLVESVLIFFFLSFALGGSDSHKHGTVSRKQLLVIAFEENKILLDLWGS